MTITDLATVKVLADPYRVRMIEAIGPDRVTVKEIAARLGERVQKLYYHVRQLQAHGILVEVDSHLVSGIVERTYALAARRFKVATDLDVSATGAGLTDEIVAIIRSLAQSAADAAARAAQRGVLTARDGTVLASHGTLRLADADAEELHTRISALIDEFSERSERSDEGAASAGQPERTPYGLTVIMHALASERAKEG